MTVDRAAPAQDQTFVHYKGGVYRVLAVGEAHICEPQHPFIVFKVIAFGRIEADLSPCMIYVASGFNEVRILVLNDRCDIKGTCVVYAKLHGHHDFKDHGDHVENDVWVRSIDDFMEILPDGTPRFQLEGVAFVSRENREADDRLLKRAATLDAEAIKKLRTSLDISDQESDQIAINHFKIIWNKVGGEPDLYDHLSLKWDVPAHEARRHVMRIAFGQENPPHNPSIDDVLHKLKALWSPIQPDKIIPALEACTFDRAPVEPTGNMPPPPIVSTRHAPSDGMQPQDYVATSLPYLNISHGAAYLGNHYCIVDRFIATENVRDQLPRLRLTLSAMEYEQMESYYKGLYVFDNAENKFKLASEYVPLWGIA